MDLGPNHRPIGLIASDDTGLAMATRIAASGQRVLLYVTPHCAASGVPRPAKALLSKTGLSKTGLSKAGLSKAGLSKTGLSKTGNIEHASTPTDIAFECDVVLSAIDDTDLFRTLLLGTPDRMGFGAEMAPGSVLVDLGVRPPRETQALLGVIGMRAVALVDAAIIAGTGSDPGILVGGYPDAVEAALPVLARLGRISRTGPLGSAHTAAALMGYMEAAHLVAREEAVSVGRALGLSPETLLRLHDDGKADDWEADDTNVARLTRRAHLARKTDLARKLAADRGISAEVIDFTRQMLGQKVP